jgi:CHASE2 domain-containing sensor protein
LIAPEVRGPAQVRWTDRAWVRALRGGRGRPFGLLLLAVLVAALLAPETRPLRLLRLAALDTYQVRLPRTRVAAPVVIVAIDEASLRDHGQWPWPRTVLARLVARVAEGKPAAIALDFVMAEPDRLSPRRLPAVLPAMDRSLVEGLSRLEDNDEALARALRGRPTVLGVGGLESSATAAASTVTQAPVRVRGGDPLRFVRTFGAALRSIDPIHEAAAGRGLISVDPEEGVVRRVPLVAAVGTVLVPALAVEMLRVASREPAFSVRVGEGGVEAVGVGDLAIRTEADGTVWVPYSPRDARRFVSATDVLAGRIEPAQFDRMLVLIGITALGVSDYQATPVDDRMPGAEIHAQVLEAIVDGALLRSPRWLRWAEAGALAAGGLLLILAVPRLPPRRSLGLFLLLLGVLIVTGLGLYTRGRLLFDPASPAVGLGLVFTAMLATTLIEADGQRRLLRRQVEEQREAAARLAGELEAARRIQMGLLPSPATALAGEERVSVWAFLEPAREVGGDLYDFFRLDEARVFVLIGDVTGKGLPASLFMALTKSVCRSAAVRRGSDVGLMMQDMNLEVTRDNPELLLVTVFAAALDTRTGVLEYCTAGHDAPYLVRAGGGIVGRLTEGGGPPLSLIDGFDYGAAAHRMSPAEMLVLMTDGVTDAVGATGERYGRERIEAVLARLPAGAGPEALGQAIREDVTRFATGVEAADDLAVVVVRWNGPA